MSDEKDNSIAWKNGHFGNAYVENDLDARCRGVKRRAPVDTEAAERRTAIEDKLEELELKRILDEGY
jgi:hypothetical protein